MKTIGLIGGISWSSTVIYYNVINELTNQYLGGTNSAKIILNSLNFSEVNQHVISGDWSAVEKICLDAAKKIENAGADYLLICSNTIHTIADEVQRSISIPLINIIDCLSSDIIKHDIKHVGLLGTIYTMETPFYISALERKTNVNVLVPKKEDRIFLNNIIYGELVRNKRENISISKLIRITETLKDMGAEGIILGCTELSLLKNYFNDSTLLFDTTDIHCRTATALSV